MVLPVVKVMLKTEVTVNAIGRGHAHSSRDRSYSRERKGYSDSRRSRDSRYDNTDYDRRPMRDSRRDGSSDRNSHHRYRSGSRDRKSSGYSNDPRRFREGRSRSRGSSSDRFDRSLSRDKSYKYRTNSPHPRNRVLRENVKTRCFECGKADHTMRDCPQVTCYRCQQVGHLAGECNSHKCTGCGGRPHRRGERCEGGKQSARHRSDSTERSVSFKDVDNVNVKWDSYSHYDDQS